MEKILSSQASNWREGRRLRAFELKEQGWKQKQIAQALGVTEGAVSQWMKRQRKGSGRLETQASTRSDTPPERRSARQSTRAFGTRSPGSRLSGRSVDVRESGYSDPKGVWSQLSSGSCESFAQSLETQPAKTAAPSESEGRASHRALETEALATAQKRALKEGRTIVFADQSGFYLLPMVVRTYAPVGETPILKENLTRDHLSAMSAITLDGKLFMTFQERSFKAEDAVRFLKHLMRQIPGKLLVIWDGSPIHRGRAVKEFLPAEGRHRYRLRRRVPRSRAPRARGECLPLQERLDGKPHLNGTLRHRPKYARP
jgi:DDE superfamily endonuclease/Homeodomain-like domain